MNSGNKTRKDKMNLLTQNSKLKKTSKLNSVRVFNFGIPAQDTCIWAGECKKFCYASKGAYIWSNVKPAFQKRFEVTKQNDFPELMIKEIKRKKATHVRIHDSGDFYSREYIQKWFKVMDLMPDVTFYAYSKSLPLFDGVKLPKNFTLIKSEGGKRDDMINPQTDRHARIFKTLEELTAAGYANASDNDLIAIGSNKNIGLLIH
jgi:hypothetical protein